MRMKALAGGALALLLGSTAIAQGIDSAPSKTVPAPFDIVKTRITTEGSDVVFHMHVSNGAGTAKPKATGKFAGSNVNAYVWPTSLNSSTVGFDPDQGIVALAVTFHPDFDDGAYKAKNRKYWHTHWVVLTKDEACGPGGLKVKDIPAGTTPTLPPTWPGAPLLIDSPPYKPAISSKLVEVRVPLAKLGAIAGASYDGVTAALHVNGDLHSPLLCVANVFKVASGNLSLPGKVD